MGIGKSRRPVRFDSRLQFPRFMQCVGPGEKADSKSGSVGQYSKPSILVTPLTRFCHDDQNGVANTFRQGLQAAGAARQGS